MEIEQKLKNKKSNIFPDNSKDLAVKYWQNCLEIIKDNIDLQAFNTWFLPIKAKSWENNRLTVQLPSQWYQEWIEEHYYQLLDMIVQRILGENAELFYETIIVDTFDIEPAKIQSPALKYPPNLTTVSNQTIKQNVQQSNLNPRYAFENFVVGKSNQLAVSVAKALSNEPDNTRFNPFFIYGASGLGKTHLAQAIGNYVMQHNPSKRCLYVSSEQFTMDFVEHATSLDSKKKNDFNSTYRNVDLLIVDDIQFLSGKRGTQDKFFHIFNNLYLEGKQIILTADRPPKEIKDIEDRLISRFMAGMNAEILVPDFNHRRELIKRKSLAESIILSDEIIDYIAKNVTKSIREIEGTLIKLIAMVTLDFKQISLDLVREIVSGLATEAKPLTIDEIKHKVGIQYNVSVEKMESKSRKHEIALARQMAMFFAHKLTNLTLKSIGRHLGNRDHSTVLHSIQAINNYLETDKKIKEQHDILEAIFNDR